MAQDNNPTTSQGKFSADSILDLLNEDTENNDEKVVMDSLADSLKDDDGKESDSKSDKAEKKDDKKVDAKAEEDDDKKADKDEDEQIDELVLPVRAKEILKKYPKLFEEFPYLKSAYYRDQQMTQIFPTVEDAQEAMDAVKNYQALEGDLLKGDIKSVFKSVRDADGNAFANIVDNLMPTLSEVDPNAYQFLVADVLKKAFMSIAGKARSTKNDALFDSVNAIYIDIFGEGFVPPQKFNSKNGNGNNGTGETDEAKKLKEERDQFDNDRFESVKTELDTRITNGLTRTIFDNIDTKGEMSSYVKKNAVKEVLENIDALIEEDDSFTRLRDRLWQSARESKFSNDSKIKIRNAYLGKAKSLLRDVIRKVRAEALQQAKTDKQVDSDNPVVKNKDVSRASEPQNQTRQRNSDSSSNNGKGGKPKGMSTVDFFNQD